MKKYYIFIVLFTSLISVSWNVIQNPNFIFVRGNQKIELKLENQKENLNWDQTSKIILNLKNIDPQKLSFSGIGISMLRNENSSTQSVLQITPTKEKFEIDTLNLRVVGRDNNDSIWMHKFSIVIK